MITDYHHNIMSMTTATQIAYSAKLPDINVLETKCGQIFVTELLEFQFHCCFCTDIFGNYEFFTNHINESHQNIKKHINSISIPSLGGCTKFGEIFISSLKLFTLCCGFCQTNLDNFDIFFEHTCCCQLQYEDDYENKPIIEDNQIIIKEEVEDNINENRIMMKVEIEDIDEDTNEIFNSTKLQETIKTERIYEKLPGIVEKPYACLICPSAFKRKVHLIEHERIHTGEKPFVCIYCNKGFAQKNKLTIHERQHTGIKPFKCSYCEKPFADKRAMIFHEGSHTGEKPYQCNYCEVAFRRKYVLVIHERRHTGERPFQCRLCEKNFTNRRACNNHEKTIHKMDNLQKNLSNLTAGK